MVVSRVRAKASNAGWKQSVLIEKQAEIVFQVMKTPVVRQEKPEDCLEKVKGYEDLFQ